MAAYKQTSTTNTYMYHGVHNQDAECMCYWTNFDFALLYGSGVPVT